MWRLNWKILLRLTFERNCVVNEIILDDSTDHGVGLLLDRAVRVAMHPQDLGGKVILLGDVMADVDSARCALDGVQWVVVVSASRNDVAIEIESVNTVTCPSSHTCSCLCYFPRTRNSDFLLCSKKK